MKRRTGKVFYRDIKQNSIFLFILLFSLVTFGAHAQYDIDNDGIDELIVLHVNPDSRLYQWEAVHLNEHRSTRYPDLGMVGDFPLMGKWTSTESYIPAICNARAVAAGRGTGWIALISTSSVNAKDRLVIGSPVYNTNAEILASNGSDLWDGTIAASSFYDEFGNGASDDVWTGSATGDGIYDGLDCNGWTTGSSGISGLVSWYGNWFWGEDGGCNQQHHFYCIKGN